MPDPRPCKICWCPTSLTEKAGKCPTFAQEGTWVHLELIAMHYIFGNQSLHVQFVRGKKDNVNVRFTWSSIQEAISEYYCFFVVACHAVLTSFPYLTLQTNIVEFFWYYYNILSHPQFNHEENPRILMQKRLWFYTSFHCSFSSSCIASTLVLLVRGRYRCRFR